MPNLYVSLASVKADNRQTSTVDDAALLRLIEEVSRAVDNETNHRFYSEIATRVYDGNGLSQLWLPDDLLTVTSLKVDEDGNGTFEKTLAVNTDYWLWPDNVSPKWRIDLNPQSTSLTAWPVGRRRIEIVGMFGYSNETALVTTLAEDDDGSETALDLTSAAALSVGDTLVIGTEQLDITAIATNTVTVTRGLNASAAAAHANGAAVYRRRFERPIERAVAMQVSRLLRDQQTGYSGTLGDPQYGGYAFASLYPAIRDMLAPYLRLVVS